MKPCKAVPLNCICLTMVLEGTLGQVSDPKYSACDVCIDHRFVAIVTVAMHAAEQVKVAEHSYLCC